MDILSFNVMFCFLCQSGVGAPGASLNWPAPFLPFNPRLADEKKRGLLPRLLASACA
jgi:hypothetical protein